MGDAGIQDICPLQGSFELVFRTDGGQMQGVQAASQLFAERALYCLVYGGAVSPAHQVGAIHLHIGFNLSLGKTAGQQAIFSFGGNLFKVCIAGVGEQILRR